MKTYTQKRGEKAFDWNKALSKDCSEMTTKDANMLYRKSSSWVTCACGNQCSVLQRYRTGRPTDDKLNDLGVTFSQDINNMSGVIGGTDPVLIRYANNYRKNAIRTLRKIEKRSAALIRKIERQRLTEVVKK